MLPDYSHWRVGTIEKHYEVVYEDKKPCREKDKNKEIKEGLCYDKLELKKRKRRPIEG